MKLLSEREQLHALVVSTVGLIAFGRPWEAGIATTIFLGLKFAEICSNPKKFKSPAVIRKSLM